MKTIWADYGYDRTYAVEGIFNYPPSLEGEG